MLGFGAASAPGGGPRAAIGRVTDPADTVRID
jgi:hypothetical protein